MTTNQQEKEVYEVVLFYRGEQFGRENGWYETYADAVAGATKDMNGRAGSEITGWPVRYEIVKTMR